MDTSEVEFASSAVYHDYDAAGSEGSTKMLLRKGFVDVVRAQQASKGDVAAGPPTTRSGTS